MSTVNIVRKGQRSYPGQGLKGLGATSCAITQNGMRVCTDDNVEQEILSAKSDALNNAPGNIRSHLTDHTPADSHPFVNSSAAAVQYPAPGAAAVAILAYTVPYGQVAVIRLLAIVAIGGGFIDASGGVIWRCLLNGQGIDGLENITAQIGSLQSPVPVQLVLQENDIFTVTAEVPAGQDPLPPTATTTARIFGWTYPLVKAQNL